jgi:hypothetical protein
MAKHSHPGKPMQNLEREPSMAMAALAKGGLTEEQTEQALGGMLRVAFEIKSEGAKFELEPRIKSYFQETVGLNEEQTTLVVRLSRRISAGIPDHGRGDARRKANEQAVAKIKEAIASGEITEEEGQAKMQAMRKRMAEQGKRPTREEMVAVKKRIRAAVENGTITEEQAEERWVRWVLYVYFGDSENHSPTFWAIMFVVLCCK